MSIPLIDRQMSYTRSVLPNEDSSSQSSSAYAFAVCLCLVVLAGFDYCGIPLPSRMSPGERACAVIVGSGNLFINFDFGIRFRCRHRRRPSRSGEGQIFCLIVARCRKDHGGGCEMKLWPPRMGGCHMNCAMTVSGIVRSFNTFLYRYLWL
jgi:hypothetical protein